jgi:hypothetical protein
MKPKQTFKEWLKSVWKWLREHLLNKEMIIPCIIGELVFWSPLIVTGLLAIIISPYYWTLFGAIYSIWVGLLPAIPIQLAFIFFAKKIIDKFKKKKETKDENTAER